MDSTAVLSTSGSSLSAQILSDKQSVQVLKKTKEIQEQEGEAALKLIDSVPQATSTPDPTSPLGQNIDVMA